MPEEEQGAITILFFFLPFKAPEGYFTTLFGLILWGPGDGNIQIEEMGPLWGVKRPAAVFLR